jgi:hypothetical protein
MFWELDCHSLGFYGSYANEQRNRQRPAETGTKPAQNSETGRDQQRPARNQHKTAKLAETSQNQHKTAKPAEISPGILVLALSVESASSADVYIYIIGAGCWIGIPSREFSVGVESWIGIPNSAAQNQHKTAKPAETSPKPNKTQREQPRPPQST